MNEPSFIIVSAADDCVLIKDMSPWGHQPTVTNAAERVVEIMCSLFEFPEGRRLEYIDSEGERAQLIIKNGRFGGFAPFPVQPAPVHRNPSNDLFNELVKALEDLVNDGECYCAGEMKTSCGHCIAKETLARANERAANPSGNPT